MVGYNILILSAGRRVELVQSFQRAARTLNIKSNIVAGDCSNTAPAIYFADKYYIMPRISEPTCFLQEEIPHFCKDFSPGTGGEFLC